MMTTSWCCARSDRPQGGNSNTGGVSCDVSKKRSWSTGGASCGCVREIRADEAGPAGDDVAHEEFMTGGGLGFSQLCSGVIPGTL